MSSFTSIVKSNLVVYIWLHPWFHVGCNYSPMSLIQWRLSSTGATCISLWPCLICIFIIILQTHLQYLDGSLLQGTEDMCAISRPCDVGCLFSNLMNFKCRSWWRHQMETFSALLAVCAGNSPAIGDFPEQRPVTRGFDIFFDLRLNKRLSKQWWGWWLETQSCPLWRHRNGCCAACFISLPVLPYIGSLVHAGLLLSPLIPQSHRPNRHETDPKPTKIIKFGERSVHSRYWFGFVGLMSVYVRADKFVGERSFKHVWKISPRQIVGCLSVICRCGVSFVGERSGTCRS